MKKGLLLFLIGIYFLFLLNEIGDCGNNRITKKKKESFFTGIIIDKFSPRKNMDPTHLKIKTDRETISIIVPKEAILIVEIGDTVTKKTNESYLYFSKRNGRTFECNYE